jgi:DNA-binding CsgD family transcriptional regulator
VTARALTPEDLEAAIARGVRRLRRVSGADLVFGGPIEGWTAGRAAAIAIRSLEGNLGRSLHGLRVVAGAGLGGKALALGRPVMIRDYFNSAEIVHRYDAAVAPERITTLMAVPVSVDGAVRGLLYVASREDVALSRGVVRQATAVAREIEREVLVDSEVRRRLATPELPTGRQALRTQLDEAIAAVTDDGLRLRLEDLTARLLGSKAQRQPGELPAERGPRGQRGPRVSGIPENIRLTPREQDVLSHVAAGLTNKAVADVLGLRTTTVKAYLKAAARKLGATNRVHAVRLAREAGLLG